MKANKIAYHLTIVGALILGLVGCGTPQKHPAVEDARAALASAENPKVSQYAPVPLEEAKEQFNKAEALWKKGADEEKIKHQAYLAKQRAAIAIEKGEIRAAEKSVQQARAERDQVRIQARAQETEIARERAERRAQEAEQAMARAESLEGEIEDLKARETERGIVLTLSDVLFDYNKAQLNAGAYRTVDRLANFLKEHPERKVLIEGFTDSSGPQDYNKQLSERRANALREALLQRGIGANRVNVRGYGEAFPVASNDTNAGRAQNRRVEVIISDVKGMIPERGS